MRYPLFDLGQKGRSLPLSAQRRLNLFAEVKPSPDKAQLVFFGTPGLALFASISDQPVRGYWTANNKQYVVILGTLYEVNSVGVATGVGSLSTTAGWVDISDNGLQLMLVDGTYGYTFTFSGSTFAKITDVDFFANPQTVTFQDGYFIVTFANSGRFQISAIRDGTNWAALDYANAESSPDNLVRVFSDHGELMLFGDVTTEFWGNTGATDFPYARIQGTAIEWGLAAQRSVAKFNDSRMFLAKNRLGEVQVVTLNGYTPQNVTTPELSAAINAYSTTSDATGFSYMKQGHAFYQLNFPTAGASWLFDGATGAWSEVSSGTLGARHLAEMAVHFGGKTYVSDYGAGKLYTLDLDTYTDNGQTIVRELVSRHVFSEQLVHVFRLWLDIETGVGNALAPGDNPAVWLSVSKDGGRTWSIERAMTIGKIGAYQYRAYVTRLGRGYDWVFKFRITDPVKVAIMGGWLDTESNANDNFVQPVPKMVA